MILVTALLHKCGHAGPDELEGKVLEDFAIDWFIQKDKGRLTNLKFCPYCGKELPKDLRAALLEIPKEEGNLQSG